MFKVSVIIPAYNADRTIERAVRSVELALSRLDALTQVIVVDDGSTDRTPALLDWISLEHRTGRVRVTVVHQKNMGCYQARITGLRLADSEYFAFADADDTVSESIYNRMLSVAQAERVDVVECGCDRPCVLRTRSEVLRQYVKPRLFGYGLACCMWDKLYRNQYDFSEWLEGDFKSMYDDILHNLQLFSRVRSMALIPDALYNYSPNAESLTRNFRAEDIAQFERVYSAKHKLMGEYETEVDGVLLSRWRGHELWSIFVKASRRGRQSWEARKQNLRIIASSAGFPHPIVRVVPLRFVLLVIRAIGQGRRVMNKLRRLCIR